jgi:hypothetical protein
MIKGFLFQGAMTGLAEYGRLIQLEKAMEYLKAV